MHTPGSILVTVSAESILSTPQKRKRQDSAPTPTQPETACIQGQTYPPSRSSILECRECTSHLLSELFKWTFSQASVAPVRARHVFEMDRIINDSAELYWMGRVPCRSVKVVGIVVGIDETENMTRFKLDDGSAVIDCELRRTQQQTRHKPLRQVKPTSKDDAKETLKPSSRHDVLPTLPAVPNVYVGAILSVQGRIRDGRGRRFLYIEPGGFYISDPNEEPLHWMEVLRLCREYYYRMEPFKIPDVDCQPKRPSGPCSDGVKSEPPSSPIPVSSPTGSEASLISTATRQPRLRHPSRLRSRDLTDVTFRIYLKHYLDFAPLHSTQRTFDESDDNTTDSYNSCATPTPRSRYKRPSSPLKTPKPRKRNTSKKQLQDDGSGQHGFTLSYLRRVPVLAEMARAVVYAEARRREKEKKKREKENKSQHAQGSLKSSSSAVSQAGSGVLLDHRLVARNMKRLFQKTIRDLYRDGNIIIWNGPTRPRRDALEANGDSIPDSDGLWKSSTKEPASSSTMTSTASSAFNKLTQEQGLDGYLSDPDENEESYLPVTARTISPFVLRALRRLMGLEGGSRVAPRRRLRAPTADEITTFLRNSDAQWTNLGSWDVEAALDWLENEEHVFKAGGGRWAVCS